MNKSSNFGMAFHQGLGFSKALMKIPATEAIFWPGCALLNLDGEILEKTLEILRRAEPEIALACGCCGQPTVYLFPEKAEKRRKKLIDLLRKRGVKRIYTACPNCTLQLKNLGLEVIPIWPVLAEYLTKEDMAAVTGSYVWHDPCPTRKDTLQQEAVRRILDLRGCDWTEPKCSGDKTLCCGNRKMLHCTDPEKSSGLRKMRVAQFPEDRIVASSCEGCLSAFRGENRQTAHLLEMLFGKSKSRGWFNRFKNTWK